MTPNDLFDSAGAAAGYASARPALHPLIVEVGLARAGWTDEVVDVALDLGCGAGLSTEPLVEQSQTAIGLDPSGAMIEALRRRVPAAMALVGRAEHLPLASGSVGLLTAAGSLDFADAERSVAEIARVLRPDGLAMVYDFTTGSPEGGGEDWLEGVVARWPRPPRAAVSTVGPRAFDAAGLAVDIVPFELPLPMERPAYVDYLVTESFVQAAIARGEAADEIRSEIDRTLPWPRDRSGPANVVFDGYVMIARQAVRVG